MKPRMSLMATELGANIGKRIYSVSLAIAESTLPKGTQILVMLRASQINGCGFCVDIHAKDAAAAGESAVRLNLVCSWRHATVFTEAERAALALAEEGTRLSGSTGGVSDETWSSICEHYDDDERIALVSLIAMINASNRLGVILNQQGGAYQPGALASVAS